MRYNPGSPPLLRIISATVTLLIISGMRLFAPAAPRCSAAAAEQATRPEIHLSPLLRSAEQNLRDCFRFPYTREPKSWWQTGRGDIELLRISNPPRAWFPEWREHIGTEEPLLVLPINIIPTPTVSRGAATTGERPDGLTFLGVVNRGMRQTRARQFLTDFISIPEMEFWPQAVAGDTLIILYPNTVSVYRGTQAHGALAENASRLLRDTITAEHRRQSELRQAIRDSALPTGEATLARALLKRFTTQSPHIAVARGGNKKNGIFSVIVKAGDTETAAIIARKISARLEKKELHGPRPGVLFLEITGTGITATPIGGVNPNNQWYRWLSRTITGLSTHLFLSDIHLVGGKKKGWYMDKQKEHALIELLQWAARHKISVFFVGDTFDMHIQPRIKKILSHHKRLFETIRSTPNLTCVSGNHDEAILEPTLRQQLTAELGVRILPYHFDAELGVLIEHGHGREREVGRMAGEMNRKKKLALAFYLEYLGLPLRNVHLELQQLLHGTEREHNFVVDRTIISSVIDLIQKTTDLFTPFLPPDTAKKLLSSIVNNFAQELTHHHGRSDYFYPENVALVQVLSTLHQLNRPVTIVQGHTHYPRLHPEPEGHVFVNTGSWAYSHNPLFPPADCRFWTLRSPDGTVQHYCGTDKNTLKAAKQQLKVRQPLPVIIQKPQPETLISQNLLLPKELQNSSQLFNTAL